MPADPALMGLRAKIQKEDAFRDVDALTAEDDEVHRLVEVLNLAKPLSALREEPLRSRVEAGQRNADARSRALPLGRTPLMPDSALTRSSVALCG